MIEIRILFPYGFAPLDLYTEAPFRRRVHDRNFINVAKRYKVQVSLHPAYHHPYYQVVVQTKTLECSMDNEFPIALIHQNHIPTQISSTSKITTTNQHSIKTAPQAHLPSDIRRLAIIGS